jgi:hypothetical protein
MKNGNENVFEIGIPNWSMHLFVLLLVQTNFSNTYNNSITTVALGVNTVLDYKEYPPL